MRSRGVENVDMSSVRGTKMEGAMLLRGGMDWEDVVMVAVKGG